MDLNFIKRSGVSYTISDEAIEAYADLLGGRTGLVVILHSIKSTKLLSGEGDSDIDGLIEHFSNKISERKNFGAGVIFHKNKVVFSLDKNLKKGTQLTPVIKQLT